MIGPAFGTMQHCSLVMDPEIARSLLMASTKSLAGFNYYYGGNGFGIRNGKSTGQHASVASRKQGEALEADLLNMPLPTFEACD